MARLGRDKRQTATFTRVRRGDLCRQMAFNSVMDTREENHRPRPAIAKFAIGMLAMLLAAGLWQGYGAGLFGAAVAHGP
jgi:hypothetical protein